MDLGRFKELYEGKRIEFQRLGPNLFQAIGKRFDSATAAELAPEIHQLNKEQVEQAQKAADLQLKATQKAIVSLTYLRAKMEELDPTPTEEGAAE